MKSLGIQWLSYKGVTGTAGAHGFVSHSFMSVPGHRATVLAGVQDLSLLFYSPNSPLPHLSSSTAPV